MSTRLVEKYNIWKFERFYNPTDNLRPLPRDLQVLLVFPDPSRVWGTDTSHWDGEVDYNVTKNAGASFVFLKAQDGTIETKNWKSNRTIALNAGLLVGDYVWLYPHKIISCVSQASTFFNRWKDLPHQLPPVVDFEWTKYNGQSANPNYDDLDRWVTEFTRLSGIKPLLYSAAGYMDGFGRISETLKKKFRGIWIANYNVINPDMPYGYNNNDWTFHQFSASGDAATLSPNDANKKEVDLNYWNGDEDSLLKFAGIENGSEPPSEGEMNMLGQVIVGALNIRREPNSNNATNPSIGQLKLNDVITADTKINGWWHITSITRSGLGVALPAVDCYSYEGMNNGYIVDITPTDPTVPVPPQEVDVKDSDGNWWKSTNFTPM